MSNDDLVLTIALGKSRKEMTWKNIQVTWKQLVKKLSETKWTKETEAEYAAMTRDERQNRKDVGGFVGGEVIVNTDPSMAGRRKKDNVRSRQILSLDMDYGSPGTEEDYALMFDWECLVHTTHSHTREKPRYRLFFPLSRPITPDEYAAVARMVANQFDMEQFDDSTYEANRMMYWSSSPGPAPARTGNSSAGGTKAPCWIPMKSCPGMKTGTTRRSGLSAPGRRSRSTRARRSSRAPTRTRTRLSAPSLSPTISLPPLTSIFPTSTYRQKQIRGAIPTPLVPHQTACGCTATTIILIHLHGASATASMTLIPQRSRTSTPLTWYGYTSSPIWTAKPDMRR